MNRTVRSICFAIWLAVFAWGVTGVLQRFSQGHLPANYGSYVPWGLWVSAYIYFIGLSAGAFLLSSLIYVFGVRSFEKIGRTSLYVSAITLLMALLSIWFDLGHLGRFYKVFTQPAFTSMMAWMVWLYTAYFVLILAELWFSLRLDLARLADKGGPLAWLHRLLLLGWKAPPGDGVQRAEESSHKALKVLGSIGVPLAIAFHGGVGALFATLSSRPYWHHTLYPILFLTGALVSGGALILAVVAFFDIVPDDVERRRILRSLSRLVLALLVFDVLLEWAEFSIPMWYGVGNQLALIKEVLGGQYWYVFWIFHVLLGVVVPVLLFLSRPASRIAMSAGGFLVAATFLSVRLNIVIPGQIEPALKGLQRAYVDDRLVFHYAPSSFEWSVVAFVAALGVALFAIGRAILPLSESELNLEGGLS